MSGSPTAMVFVGRPWYRIINRTLELREFSAGKYSMGIGLPELDVDKYIRILFSCHDQINHLS